MSREFAEMILAATLVLGFYVLIMAITEGLSEWLTKRVLGKGQLATSECGELEDLVDDLVDDLAEDPVENLGEQPEELNHYSRIRSYYRSNRRQARR